jgi:diguanylate cyclase (GGDEF)-like protein
MIRTVLRRFGLWPVIAGVTLISIVVSVALTGIVHAAVLGLPMPPVSWVLSIGCPLLLAPTMSRGSFSLLLELDRAHERLRIVSNTDYLTGTSNRRHFMERLLEEVESSARGGPSFSVALIDIDDFKTVNDEHGHLAGDEVLRRIARACMEQVREGDTFARFGGEEFAVLLPRTDIEQSLQWLERLRQHVAQLRVDLPHASLTITVSIGLASPGAGSPAPATQINTALRLADEALYRAKREGKNRVALPLPVAA